jgi:hypothetical protein
MGMQPSPVRVTHRLTWIYELHAATLPFIIFAILPTGFLLQQEGATSQCERGGGWEGSWVCEGE